MRGDRLMQLAGGVAKAPRQRILRHDGEADLGGDQHGRRAPRRERREQFLAIGAQIRLGEQAIAQPQSEAVDEQRKLRRRLAHRLGERMRRLDRAPIAGAPLLMRGDATAHLLVEGLRRGDIGPGAGLGGHEPLGEGALAGARAAEDEGQMRIFGHSIRIMQRRDIPITPPCSDEARARRRRRAAAPAGRRRPRARSDIRRDARLRRRSGEARQSGVIGLRQRLAGMGARPEEIAPLAMEFVEPRREFRIAAVARAGDIGDGAIHQQRRREKGQLVGERALAGELRLVTRHHLLDARIGRLQHGEAANGALLGVAAFHLRRLRRRDAPRRSGRERRRARDRRRSWRRARRASSPSARAPDRARRRAC